jgi:hypothetical protein
MLALDAIGAIALLATYFEWSQGLIRLNRGANRPVWRSVTPGAPNRIPLLFAMLYGPCPLPRAQYLNAFISVSIRPDRPVILRGRPNNERYWSFAFYGAGMQRTIDGLAAIDSSAVELERDGSYVVSFSPDRSGKNWVPTGGCTSGFIAMRNYVPATGTQISLPAVYWGDQLVCYAQEYANE